MIKFDFFIKTVSDKNFSQILFLFNKDSICEKSLLMCKWCYTVPDETTEEIICCLDLESLDLSNCPNLLILDCSNTYITSLDVSKCTKLKELQCSFTNISSLDLSNCTKLEDLGCGKTQISSLDMSKCVRLEYLWCISHHLLRLNLQKNKKLNDIMLTCEGKYIDKIGRSKVLSRVKTIEKFWYECLNYDQN